MMSFDCHPEWIEVFGPILSQEDAEDAEEIVTSGLISAPSAPSCKMPG